MYIHMYVRSFTILRIFFFFFALISANAKTEMQRFIQVYLTFGRKLRDWIIECFSMIENTSIATFTVNTLQEVFHESQSR